MSARALLLNSSSVKLVKLTRLRECESVIGYSMLSKQLSHRGVSSTTNAQAKSDTFTV